MVKLFKMRQLTSLHKLWSYLFCLSNSVSKHPRKIFLHVGTEKISFLRQGWNIDKRSFRLKNQNQSFFSLWVASLTARSGMRQRYRSNFVGQRNSLWRNSYHASGHVRQSSRYQLIQEYKSAFKNVRIS
jgi:hypothetical protein